MHKKNVVTLAGLLMVLSLAGIASGKPLNVLFIGVDDLRVQLNSYGYPQMKTPNFDRMAEMGVQFNRAYVQQAVCAASRASFLTGCRPDTTGVNYPYSPWFEDVFIKQYKPVAQVFAENGFYARTLGKIHHGPSDAGLSEPHFGGKTPDFLLPENQHPGKKPDYIHLVKPWEHADLPDNAYGDGQIADETIATIRRAVKQDKPFFIAPGFKKPHLPFVCPKKYYDLYSDKDIELAPHPKRGKNQPAFTVTSSTGASKWWKYPETGIDDENARQLIHSYYACTSFIDAQLGKILDELEAQNLLDSTVVVVWSDHGWHLGDHGMWGKSTCYEWSAHAPLFAYVPGMKAAGKPTDALVEYVDLFPSVLDLCGLPIPDYLEGTSFAPLLQDVSKPWKKAAFSQFPRNDKELGNLEGYSLRTKDFRYTRWVKHDGGQTVFEELYDERANLLETENLAGNPEFKQTLEEHRDLFSKGWKNALPPGVKTTSNMPRGDDSWYYKGKKERTDADVPKTKKKKGKGGKNETSENKPWIADFFKRNPKADTNGDGVLARDEVELFRAEKKK
ncbi:MAG: sulfatase [Kiritimatiellales bacterium]|nr:sulfatase [Kiritimatiellales bacterium]